MSAIDEIAVKRQEARQKQATEANHNQNIDAVTNSGKEVVVATDKLAKSDDIDSVIKQLKELQLTQLLEAQSAKIPKPDKPTIILTDQTDLGDRLTKLVDDITAAVTKLDSSGIDKDQLTALKDLQSSLTTYSNNISSSSKSSQKATEELLKAVKSIKVSPIVNLPEPKVTVQQQKVDLRPLQDTIQEYFGTPDVDEKIYLECFKVQDLRDDGDLQYVGFLHPNGNWYIIENKVKENSLRYIFGVTGYSEAFSKAATYEYSLLDEAINALST